MTTVAAEGPVGDLLEALGLLHEGTVDGAFFSDPGGTLKGLLHDARRRGRLLALAQAVLTEAGLDLGPAQTVDGRDWLPLIGPELGSGAPGPTTDHLDLSLVLDHTDAARTVLGLGVRYTHDAPANAPRLAVHAVVPLVSVPVTGDAVLAPGTALGVIAVDAALQPGTEGGAVDVETLRVVLDVPTDGVHPPHVVVTAEGLRLGDADPVDLVLDTDDPLVDQALHVGATLLRGLAESAEPRLGGLLRLLGLGADAAVPDLPLAELAAHGRSALWAWLRSLASPAASAGWVRALAALVSEHATVDGDGSPEHPARLRLPLGPAVLEIAVVVTAGPDGSPVVTPRITVGVESPASGAVPRLVGRLEVDVVTLRLGAVPTATAVPGLRLVGRAGPEAPRGTATALVEQTTPVPVVVGSVAAGLTLDENRRVAPLLAAYEVSVGTGDRRVVRPKVDLTDAAAVADLGASTLDALVDEALTALGAGEEVRAALALLGLRDPHGHGGTGEPAWTHRTALGDLLADPLAAIAAFLHDAVTAGDAGALLAEVARLLPGPSAATAITGTGTPADPWLLPLDSDPGADVWLTGVVDGERLGLGLRAAPAPIAVPSVGRLTLAVDASLVSLTLPAAGSGRRPGAELAADLAVRAVLTGPDDGAGGTSPVRLGSGSLGVEVTQLAGGLRWTPATGLRATGSAVGLAVDLDGEALPLRLPSLDPATGALVLPEPPFDVLEALVGHGLRASGGDVLRGLGDLLGWGEPHGGGTGSPSHLPLDGLVTDPVAALASWLRGMLAGGDVALTLTPVLGWLSTAIGGALAPGGADDGDPGVTPELSGTGTPRDPWTISLRDRSGGPATGAAGRRGGLVVWCEPDGPDLPVGSALTGLALPSWLDLGVGEEAADPSPADLAALLLDAATVLPAVADVVRDRGGLAASLTALRDRLAGGDGVLPAFGAAPPGWVSSQLPGVTHGGLQAAWDDPALDPASTVLVTGPLGDPARWPLYDAARLLDLTAPGLPAAAFDVSAASAGPGPWFVALSARGAARTDPTAAGDGFVELTARLRAALIAARAGAGTPLTVVAHSSAGLPARVVAADPGLVVRLVTLGTPLAGATVSTADVRPTADAVHALRALWAASGLDATAEGLPEELGEGAELVATLDRLQRGEPVPPAELAAPPSWPAEATGVVREAVQGVLDTAAVTRAMAVAVRGAMQGALAAVGALPPVLAPVDASGDPIDATDGAGGTRAVDAARPRRPVTAIASGVRHDVTSAPDSRGVTVGVRTTLTGPRLGADPPELVDDATGAPLPPEVPAAGLRAPALELRLVLRREGGWLVGGPLPEGSGAPATRPPRLRWAEVVLASELRPGGTATAEIVLHEAAALGVERVAWTLRLDPLAAAGAGSATGAGGGAATLPAEARVLLFRLASALGTTEDGGALPASGTSRALVDLLAVLGLATVDGTGRVGLVTEAVERLLTAPMTTLREAVAGGAVTAQHRRDLAQALRVLLGAATGSGGPAVDPARVDVEADGLRLRLDLEPLTSAAPATLTVSADVPLVAGLGASGSVELALVEGGPRAAGSLRLGSASAGSGLPFLAVDLAAGAPTLTCGLDLPAGAATTWLPRRVVLWPLPAGTDEGAVVEPLLQLALAAVPSVLGRLGLDAARTALRGSPAGGALDALLRALDMLSDDDVPRVPPTIVLDPGGWLRGLVELGGTGGAGARAAAGLVDAVRALAGLGTTTTPAGHLPLPYGLSLVAAGDPSGGGLSLTLATSAPVDAAGAVVELAAGVRLAIGAGGAVAVHPHVVAGVGLRPAGGDVLASVRLTADDVVRLDLVLPGPPDRTYALVPAGPGLGALVGEAAVRLLPTVLDAVVREAGDTGDVVGSLGDALGLREGTGTARHFSGTALEVLGGDPAAALQARVRDAVAEVVSALGDLVSHVLGPMPSGVLVVDTSVPARVLVRVAGRVTLTLSGTAADLCLDVAADVPVRIDGTALGTVRAAVGVDGRGLALVRGAVALDGDLLVVLGVPLRPWVEAGYAPGERGPGGAETPASRPTLRAGLLVPQGTPGPLADARAVVVTVVPGVSAGVGVVGGTGLPVGDDPGLAVAQVLVPLLMGLGTEALQDLLGTVVGSGSSGPTVGDLLDGVLLRRVGPTTARRWAPVPDLLDPDAILGRIGTLAGNLVAAFAPSVTAGPLQVTGTATVTGSVVSLGVRLSVADGETWWLVDAGSVRFGVEVATAWLGMTPAEGGLELSLTLDPSQPDPVRAVGVAVRGATVRVAGRQGEDLLDLGVRLRSVALSAAFVPTPPTLYGGRLALDRISIPLGGAGGGGGNGVASKVLQPAPTSGTAGTPPAAQAAPGLSPELSLVSRAGGPVRVDLRMGDGDGPWWLPLQAHLGPVYVEQVGFGVTRTGDTVTWLRLLIDGGVSLAGLTVQVDDLELDLPWPAPWDVAHWRLDLAGLAVGYQGSGVTIAGALTKTAGTGGAPPSYLGMLTVSAAGFGINAFGGFGVYPVPGSSQTYVSMFVVAALHAPLGGPPAFFLTGVGGGFGVNRALVLPTDVAALPRFPLIQALDPGSTIASDPMGALTAMGQAFPPRQGAVWFAAGVSFTSFSLLEGVAVISVGVGDGVEVAILALARLGLPNPRLPLAQIELALIARFSTRDAVLWVQAQLTDNSWVISHDARLTGGFAFVTWFRTGDFVVTLGGYHPNFHVAHYPQVPRVGLSWTLGQFLSIRGETYFALCSSAVMVGARIDVSFRAGPAFARIVAGFDALVRFDPLWFEIDIYASVTGGIRIEIDLGWFGTIRIDLTITIGAQLHVEGPEVHGTAMLQMGPVQVPFRFGPQAPPERQPLGWTVFVDKYLRSGGGQVLTSSVVAGQLAGGDAAESRNDGTDPLRPWLVLPEFGLAAATTLPARTYAAAPVAGVGGLGIAPMDVPALGSDLRVTVRAAGVAGAAGDRTAALQATPTVSGLPPAVWRALPPGQSAPPLPSGVDLVPGCTGVALAARARVADDGGSARLDPDEVEQDRNRRKPLPFPAEQTSRTAVRPAAADAVRSDVSAVSQAELARTALAWAASGPDGGRSVPRSARLLPKGVTPLPDDDPERARLLLRRARQWQALPRPVRITEGLGPRTEVPAEVTQRPAEPPAAALDTAVGEPSVVALLDLGAAALPPGGRTTVTALKDGGVAGAARLPRRAAPPADPAKAPADRAVAARLLRGAAPGTSQGGAPQAAVRTSLAGGATELRRGPAAAPGTAAALDGAAAALTGQGVTVVPGQALVLALGNPHHDADAERPRLAVTGSAPVRVVALDATGRPLGDTTLVEGDVPVPIGTASVVLLGVGVATPAGLPGWAASVPVVQALPGCAVAAGCVVRGPAAARRLAVVAPVAAGAAVVAAGALVGGTGIVETVLPAGTRSLVIALDSLDAEVVPGLAGLVLGLRGLRRRSGPDGELPPVCVGQGRRTVLLYPVEDDVDEQKALAAEAAAAGRTRPEGTVVVSIASDERWSVAAVAGATGSPERLAREVVAGGVERLLAPVVVAATGASRVTWTGRTP